MALKTNRIGSLEVTEVGLGCNNFGWRMEEKDSVRVIHAALDAGINFFDTADIYGGTKSEEILGKALKGKRAVIATKFGMEVDAQRKGAKPDYVKRACEDSLRRLSVDCIDLYQLHQPDPSTPIGDTLAALDDLVKAGKVREIGCSNFSAAQLREARQAAKGARFVSVQNQYSALHRDDEQEVLPEAARQELAYLPFFPLESGLLSGKYRKGKEAPEGARLSSGKMAERFRSEAKLLAAEKLRAFAEARGHTLLELAFGYLLAHKPVASVIAGATKIEQVQANAAAATWRLTPEELSEVRRLAS
ncbi:MAG TPA: aldo/keto reductase [Myxococcales bacterium]|jgi:aryl-alcohol dehydrogenase-like predicted oxidoreductase